MFNQKISVGDRSTLFTFYLLFQRFIMNLFCWREGEEQCVFRVVCSEKTTLNCVTCVFVGNESCPQPQTSEHLAAIEIMKLKHILILQNKIDLVKESQAREQYEQIQKFVQGGWACLRVLIILTESKEHFMFEFNRMNVYFIYLCGL